MLARFEEIEKATGVTFVVKNTGGYSEFQSNFTAAMLSNDFYADIIDAQI